MFSWAPYAMLRFSLFFIAGILFAIYSGEVIDTGFAQAILFTSLLLFFAIRFIKQKLIQAYGYILVIPVVFLAGYLCLHFHSVINRPDHLSKLNAEVVAYQLHVSLAPEEKPRSFKVEGDIVNVETNDAWQKASGRVLLYLSKSELSAAIHYGDLLLIHGRPEALSGPANPHEFDYKRFLSFRNIYHQQFVPDAQWVKLGSEPKNLAIFYAQKIRSWAATQLQTHITSKQQQVIALALVLGMRDGIDNELQDAYAASGAMHVLAVSGLHVGVIFLLLNLVFKQLTFFERRTWLQALINICFLWFFAFVTGLSASVLRAVTMFSLIVMAKAAGRGDNIYNTLAAAAVILLLIDPYLIMSVGFQLSFLAVLGIVSITRGVYDLWEPRFLLVDKIWQITCVAFAAQLSTFALGILYFHQFPSYFFFSNLFVIPGAFIILLSGIACLAFAALPGVSGILGGITEVCIWFLNKVVFFIEALPYSKVDNIYIETAQTWLVLLLIAALVIFFSQQKIFWLKLSFFLAIGFAFYSWFHFYHSRSNPSLTFYKVNGLMAFDWIENGNAYFFTDNPDWNDEERIRFHIRPNRLANSVHTLHRIEGQQLAASEWGNLLQVKNKSIFLLKQTPEALKEPVHVNYLILDKNWKGNLSAVLPQLSFDQLIISSAINYRQAAKLQREALNLGISSYNIQEQGALTINL